MRVKQWKRRQQQQNVSSIKLILISDFPVSDPLWWSLTSPSPFVLVRWTFSPLTTSTFNLMALMMMMIGMLVFYWWCWNWFRWRINKWWWLRDADLLQNGWIFGKVPNSHWPRLDGKNHYSLDPDHDTTTASKIKKKTKQFIKDECRFPSQTSQKSFSVSLLSYWTWSDTKLPEL